VRRLEAFLSLIAVVLAAALLAIAVYAHGGFLERRVAQELAHRTNGRVGFERVWIDWRAPGLVVQGLHLAGAPEQLRLERVHLDVGVGLRGARLARVWIEGGRARLGPGLYAGLRDVARAVSAQTAADADAGDGSDEPFDPRATPSAVASAVEVEIELPGGGVQPLGRADLWWMPRQRDGAALIGLATLRFGPDRPALAPVAVRGSLGARSALDFAVSAPNLEVPAGALVEDRWFAALGLSQVAGVLRLDGRGSLFLDGSRPPKAEIDLAFEELRWESEDPLLDAQAASLRGRLEFSPGKADLPLDPASLGGELALEAQWNEGPLSLRALLGRDAGPNHLARIDLWVPRVPIGSPLTLRTARASTGPNTGRSLAEAWAALEPGGVASLVLSAELESSPGILDGSERPEPKVVFRTDTLGETTLRFVGWPDDEGRTQGFPVPLAGIRGALVFAHSPKDPRRDRFGLIDVAGSPPSGAARIVGLIVSPEVHWELRRPEVRLALELDDLRLDDDLARGLAGLDHGFDPLAQYAVRDGLASARIHFEQHPANDGMRLGARIALAGVEAAVPERGIHVARTEGSFELVFARETQQIGAKKTRPLDGILRRRSRASRPSAVGARKHPPR